MTLAEIMNNMCPAFIIAEAGVNSNGECEKAFELIDAAADAGANAIKFQTFKADKLALSSAPKTLYQKRNTNTNENQLEMLRGLELPLACYLDLQNYAQKRGIVFLSTAFDLCSLRFLQTLDLPIYKIPSGEITNAPLLWAFAQTLKPLILSTGMATLGEIEQAMAILSHGMMHEFPPKNIDEIWLHWSNSEARMKVRSTVSLLHCTSQYPAPIQSVNLKAMDTLAQLFNVSVGYSDHTEGILVSIAAVARGASTLEKHLTLDRNLPGPDHKASLEPHEFARMVGEIRSVEKALGHSDKVPHASEWDTRRAVRQSLVTSRPICKNEILNETNMTTARTGAGVSAVHYWDYIGQIAYRDFQEGENL